MKKELFPMDLQFFADEGGEEPEVADQDVGDEPEETEETGDSEEGEEEEDRDSIYAAARRRAESEAKAKYEKKQAEMDAYYAELCKGRVNPETNMPITTEAEYREAMEAQRRMAVQQELQDKGVNPSVIEQYIANSPEIKESRRMLAELQDREARAQVEEDIKSILALDHSYENADDLIGSDAFQSAIEMCKNTPGLRVQDAYKIVNFDNLRDAGVKAAKQAAVNEARGKDHLKSTPKSSTGKESVEIPESEYSKWKRFYPDKSRKELNALYAKVHAQ